MSVPIEGVAGQQNQANDVPYPNTDTTAQHIEWLFGMPEVPSTKEETQKKARRGRPKYKTEEAQSDGPSQQRKLKQKQNVKKRK